MSNIYFLREHELRFIRDHMEDMTLGEIAVSLGRSYACIQKNVAKMGLSTVHRWTKEEDARLLALYGKYSAGYLASLFGVNVNSVYNRIRRLNGRRK